MDGGDLNGIYILSNLSYGYLKKSNISYERAEMMLDASFFTLLTTVSLKTAIKEKRPGFPDENDSFPSGHTSMSFAFASIVTATHDIHWGASLST